MAIPVANFDFKTNGLSVDFTDRSSSIPTGWVWDFGDSTTSTIQNPSHTYTTAGSYKVTLAASNTDGSDTFEYDLIISATPPVLNATIKELVEFDLPGITSVETEGFIQLIRKWQLFYQTAAKIADADVFDETKWPTLWNVLISKEVGYDLVLRGVASASGLSTLGNIAQVGIGKGSLKSIEAGPSKAGWYDPSVYWSNLFKSTAGGSESVISSFQEQACAYGYKLGVKVPGCKALKQSLPFIVSTTCNRINARQWPASKGAWPWFPPPCTNPSHP